MTLLAHKRLRVEQDVITQITRSLSGKGEIFVQPNQEVTPSEIIATSQISSGFRTINLSKVLSVPPKEVVKYLKIEVGKKIYKGELLAFRPVGLFRDQIVVTAPTDGILDYLNTKTGEVRMTFLPKKVDLPAGVFGVVENIDEIHGKIVIRTQVTKIYGVFGTGRVRDGILHILNSKDSLIGHSLILPKYDENILVGGSFIHKQAISESISAGVNGIITGGIDPKDFRGMAGGRLIFPRKLENDVGLSIVVCEGFGSISIGSDIFEILEKYEGKFASLDGNSGIISLANFESSSMTRVKNTKLPAKKSFHIGFQRLEQMIEVKIGQKVRVIGSSFVGEQGTILSIDKSETLLPSGIKSYLLTIETKRRKIQVPVNNIEVIG